MDYRFLLSLAKRMVAILSYLVLNAAFSLAFVLLTMRIAYGNDDSPALGLVMFMEFAIVFSMGLLWGLIYLSAFLKKSGSISVWSIVRADSHCFASESVRDHCTFLPSLRTMSRIEASNR